MSTRCIVIIQKEGYEDVQLYHHCDGYPEGVGKDLDNLFEEISRNECYSTIDLGSLIEVKDDSFEYEGTGYAIHRDIEYYYIINLTENTISCFNIPINKTATHEQYVHGDRGDAIEVYTKQIVWKDELPIDYEKKYRELLRERDKLREYVIGMYKILKEK